MKLEDPKIVWGDIKKSTIPLVVSGLKLWPLAHCVTYGLMPGKYILLNSGLFVISSMMSSTHTYLENCNFLTF